MCESLFENLVYVGKICDDENFVVFDKHCYAVFKGKLECSGNEIHAQDRDLQSGLYPVSLTTTGNRDCRTKGIPLGPLYTNTHFCNITEMRKAFAPIHWARNVCAERNKSTHAHSDAYAHDSQTPEFIGALARFYVRGGMSDMERWHNKLGHVGSKIIRSCNIPGLKIPVTPFMCEGCIKETLHSGDHPTKSTGRGTDLKPGEYIITDLQGPYVRNLNGHKYTQLFRDVKSKRMWVMRMRKKSHSDESIKAVIRDAKIRSRNDIRVLRTGMVSLGDRRNFRR